MTKCHASGTPVTSPILPGADPYGSSLCKGCGRYVPVHREAGYPASEVALYAEHDGNGGK